MHGMLAISALHLSSLRRAEILRFKHLSRQHQNAAIPEYRNCLANIQSGNGGPVLAMACILGLVALASISDNAAHGDGDGDPAPSIDTVVILFAIIRGVQGIMAPRPFREWMDGTPYLVLARGHAPGKPGVESLPEGLAARYSTLKLQCLPDLAESGDTKLIACCMESILHLEQVHREIFHHFSQDSRETRLEPSFLIRWIAMVSPDFVALLRSHHPAALLIIACYFDIYRPLSDVWYLKGWTRNGLQAIEDALGPPGESG